MDNQYNPSSQDWLSVQQALSGNNYQNALKDYTNGSGGVNSGLQQHQSSYGGAGAGAGLGGDRMGQVNNMEAAQARQRFWQGQNPASISQQRFVTQGLAPAMAKMGPDWLRNISPEMQNYIKQNGQGVVAGAGGNSGMAGYNPGGGPNAQQANNNYFQAPSGVSGQNNPYVNQSTNPTWQQPGGASYGGNAYSPMPQWRQS